MENTIVINGELYVKASSKKDVPENLHQELKDSLKHFVFLSSYYTKLKNEYSDTLNRVMELRTLCQLLHELKNNYVCGKLLRFWFKSSTRKQDYINPTNSLLPALVSLQIDIEPIIKNHYVNVLSVLKEYGEKLYRLDFSSLSYNEGFLVNNEMNDIFNIYGNGHYDNYKSINYLHFAKKEYYSKLAKDFQKSLIAVDKSMTDNVIKYYPQILEVFKNKTVEFFKEYKIEKFMYTIDQLLDLDYNWENWAVV